MSDLYQPEQPSTVPLVCPECDAPYQRGTRACWLCGRSYETGELDHTESLRPYASPQSEQAGSYTLATLMLMITLISVCLGSFSIHPGLGAGLSILSLPAFLFTWGRVDQRQHQGKATTANEKVWTFIVALGLIVMVCVASIGSFFASCAVGLNAAFGSGPDVLVVFAYVSPVVGIASLVGGIYVARKLWQQWPFGD